MSNSSFFLTCYKPHILPQCQDHYLDPVYQVSGDHSHLKYSIEHSQSLSNLQILLTCLCLPFSWTSNPRGKKTKM